MKKFRWLILLVIILLIAGCAQQKAASKDEKDVRNMIEKSIKEARTAGNFINQETPERWIFRSVEVDNINKQTLALVEIKTEKNLYLFLFDYRKKGTKWEYYFAGKEERFSYDDIENPYRYWIRRFLYNSAFCFR